MSVLVFVIVVVLLICFSAVCSGLNVALMALEPADLKRKARLGNRQAKAVLPLRLNSNLSLAAILLANVAAVSATTLVLGSRFTGWIAGIATTLLIVVFGEIFPQSYLIRRPLSSTARFAPLLKVMINCSWPLAKPLQLLLDKTFGKHTPRKLQSRHELGLLIAEHADNVDSELDDDEVEIIRGALLLSEKRVRDIMTPIIDVYWLTPDVLIDDKKIEEIKARRRSRIPVFNSRLTRFYGVLLVKDLVDVDFDEQAYRVSELQLYRSRPVGSMTALDTMFRRFIAARTHLIPVEQGNAVIGVITIEDLLEEIVGHEIEDESDRARVAGLIS